MSLKTLLAKQPHPQKIDAAYIIKTAVCILTLLAAMAAFSYTCRGLLDNYFIILLPSLKTTVPWLIRLAIYALLLGIMAGLVTVLVRPIWLTFLAFLVAAAIFPLAVGPGDVTWIAAGVFFILLALYLARVANQMRNQISFSVHPLSDMKMGLFLVLTALVSVAFALGYGKDSAQRGYILPPEIKTPAIEFLFTQAKPFLMSQIPAKAPAAQKEAAMKMIQGKVQTFIDDTEKKLLPYRNIISAFLGIILFSILSVVFLVLAFVSLPVLGILFFILRITRFAHQSVEMREVKHLTLRPVADRK